MKALKDLAKRLGVTIIDLVTSKKALAAVAGVLVGIFVKDAPTRDHIVYVIMTYIGAQGFVDHAKASAEKKLGLDGVAPLSLETAAPAAAPATKPPAV